MGIRRCLLVARASGKSVLLIRRRLERISAFYSPLGAPRVSQRYVDAAGTLIAVIDFDDRSHDLAKPAVFGAQPPSELESAAALLDAGEATLRGLTAPLAMVAADAERVRIVTACCPPTMLYEASGPEIRAWSSHAVAAAVIARGTAALNAAALAEFLAAQFVGGEQTLIRESTAVDTATSITLGADEVTRRSYWPARERWRLVDSQAAYAHAEGALLATLPRQVAPYARPFCGLTGGLDSRLAAVSLAAAEVEFEALTFGEDGWPDFQAAPGIAAGLGVPHRHCAIEWTGDGAALRAARAETRWHEGAIQVGLGRIPWPSPMSAWVTGSGGETGRAFYYRERALADPDPAPDRVAEALREALLHQIEGATDDARRAVRRAADAWLFEARALGADGWGALDVVYAEQRLRRWLRGMLTHHVGPTLPAFGDPEVQRGLASLPLAERTSDGFHRRFLATHAPELRAAERNPTRTRLARRALARLRRGVGPRAPSLLGAHWSEHPEFHAWLAEEILRSPALIAALGESWCDATRSGFLRGEGAAETRALWAAGPIALGAELRDLG